MASVTNTTSTTAADVFASINGTTKSSTSSTAAAAENKFLTLLRTKIRSTRWTTLRSRRNWLS